jgi:ATP phosphoribosyltransferase
MTAFYEFDYFIKEYFLLMKQKYPSRYNELKRYRPFTEAYSAIRTSYKELVSNYLVKIRSEMAALNSNGKAEVTLEGYDLWVREGSSDTSTGTPIFSKDLEILATVLESDRYREIAEDFPDIGIK